MITIFVAWNEKNQWWYRAAKSDGTMEVIRVGFASSEAAFAEAKKITAQWLEQAVDALLARAAKGRR